MSDRVDHSEMDARGQVGREAVPRQWQERLVQGMLRAVSAAATLAMAYICYSMWRDGDAWTIPFYLAAYGALLLATFLPRLTLELRAGILIALAYGLGILDLIVSGRGGDGRIFMLTGSALVTIFLGSRAGIVSQIANAVVMVLFAWAYASGQLEAKQPRDLLFVVWGVDILVLAILGVLLLSALNLILSHLSHAQEENQALARTVEAQEEVQRSHAAELDAANARIAMNSAAVDIVAEVARQVTAVTAQIGSGEGASLRAHDLQQMLPGLVSLIGERLGFYHVGLFLIGESGEWAELRAASSPGGKRMLARRHRLRVGQEGLVGYVARHGEPLSANAGDSQWAADGGEDAVHFDNPDLPETRSEIAVPLRDRGQVLGVLDAQSVDNLSSYHVAILQLLADQMVVVMQSMRLYEQVQGNLAAEQRTVDQLSGEAWLARIRQGRHVGYHYDGQGVARLDLTPGTGGDEQPAVPERERGIEWVSPVRVRGRVIGEIKAHKPGEGGEWTAAEIELIETLVEQLDVALESARLYEDTQDRAARDRLIRETTGRMRESLDIETVLQVAVQEIHQSLGLAALDIRLHTEEE